MIAKTTSSLEDSQIYRLLAGLVVPRPIAFVSTLSAEGVPNLAPFSFFTVLNDVPPIVGISFGLRFGKALKDSLINIRATGEFVVNIVSEDIARQMNIASLDWGPEVDEFGKTGLEPASDSLVVRPARVRDSPAAFECRLERDIVFPRYTLIAGEVVAFHYREDLFDERFRIDYERLQVVGRLTGHQYCHVNDRFEIVREADTPADARNAQAGAARS